MKKLVKTKGLTNAEWLEKRRLGIGGSDASVILGLNKNKSVLELWREKTNRVSIEETENNYTHFGHVMEPVIKKEFTQRTGLKVRSVNYILQSTTYNWALANLDGIVKEKDGSYAIFEAKTATEFKRDVWEKGVPKEYYAQVQHYFMVLGEEYQKAYVCAIVGGNTYFCHEIYRDEDYINNLIEKEKTFWECVVNDQEPIPDGSEATTNYLNNQYAAGIPKEIELPEHVGVLIDNYKELDEDIKALSEKKDVLSNSIKALMKEYEKGVVGNHVISWKTIKKKSLSSAKVKEMLNNDYESCFVESTYRRFCIA